MPLPFQIKTVFPLLGFLIINAIYSNPLIAQRMPSSPEQIKEAIRQRHQLTENSLLKDYPARSIGPVVQGARITDLAVNQNNPKTFYVAYASGGIFKTTNNGISFKPVFDNQGSLTIGDIALAPSDENIIYVGTGENNSSRSSYAGAGIYKSTDAGNTWQHLGLDNIQHTGRVIIHPNNPSIVWVAAMGALYSHNEERGVFKSTDGGNTWNKTLFINDSTGVIDLVINPENPDQLWAAAWERTRKAWNFKGNGLGSGIYISNDGGETWTRSMEGFPDGKVLGRIGLDVSQGQPNILYALLDNQYESKEKKETEQEKEDIFTLQDFTEMSKEKFLELEASEIDTFLKANNFPKKYDAVIVKQEILEGKYTPKALAEYFGDANKALFDTKVKGAEVYKSEDAGKTWNKVNSYDLEGVYYTYGYYFGEIRISPANTEHIYIMGVPMLKSLDGGKTFSRADTVGNVHADHHAMWINPQDPEHVILGNDGGLYMSYDGGAEWLHINNTAVGQFYTVNVDMEKPYNVYGGLQDNGVLMGSSKSVPNETEEWERIFGGDGMFVAPDPEDNNIVYTGFQFGNYYRIDRKNKKHTYITPNHNIGEPVLRFNWRAPLILSKHNPDILYIGAQKLFRSLDSGKSWEAISDDLTTNQPQGNVPYSTITTVSESPLKFGLLYAGTDDGNIQVTRDGANWELISADLPQGLWVSSVFASPYDKATVFATLTGYRFDDFSTYIFKSSDYGKNWTSIQGNLPHEPMNVIVQDPVNPDLLYTGSDHGTYLSLDGGKKWEIIYNIPNAASYDMIVHPRDHELVVATHGRSIYVMDVKPLQQLNEGAVNKAIVAFEPENVEYSDKWGEQVYPYLKPFQPKVELLYYSGTDAGEVQVEIFNENGDKIQSLTAPETAGFHKINWDLKKETVKAKGKKKDKDKEEQDEYVDKGKYKIKFTKNGQSDEATLVVK